MREASFILGQRLARIESIRGGHVTHDDCRSRRRSSRSRSSNRSNGQRRLEPGESSILKNTKGLNNLYLILSTYFPIYIYLTLSIYFIL